LTSRERQQLPGQCGSAIGLRTNLEKLVLQIAFFFSSSDSDVGPAHDGAYDVVKIVRDAAGEPANGFEALQLMYLLLQTPALLALFRLAQLALH
jgi:hypothetical protein